MTKSLNLKPLQSDSRVGKMCSNIPSYGNKYYKPLRMKARKSSKTREKRITILNITIFLQSIWNVTPLKKLNN